MNLMLLIETLYLILVAGPAVVIYFKTRKLYLFSRYRGIKYFSAAFMYIFLGFLIRYIVMLIKIFAGDVGTINSFDVLTLMMEFLLLMPGFLILYSLVWQRFENDSYGKKRISPLIAIYVLAGLIAVIDTYYQGFYLLYASQIIVFLIAAYISLTNYRAQKNNMRQLYLISMILFSIVWIINMIAQYTIDTIPQMRIYAYTATIFACLIILYITCTLTRDFR